MLWDVVIELSIFLKFWSVHKRKLLIVQEHMRIA